MVEIYDTIVTRNIKSHICPNCNEEDVFYDVADKSECSLVLDQDVCGETPFFVFEMECPGCGSKWKIWCDLSISTSRLIEKPDF